MKDASTRSVASMMARRDSAPCKTLEPYLQLVQLNGIYRYSLHIERQQSIQTGMMRPLPVHEIDVACMNGPMGKECLKILLHPASSDRTNVLEGSKVRCYGVPWCPARALLGGGGDSGRLAQSSPSLLLSYLPARQANRLVHIGSIERHYFLPRESPASKQRCT
jgi:hypothetical protein